MTFMYRLTLDCAHFILHGPVKQAAHICVGDPAVCQICPPLQSIYREDMAGRVVVDKRVYPTRIIVNVEEVPEDLLPLELS